MTQSQNEPNMLLNLVLAQSWSRQIQALPIAYFVVEYSRQVDAGGGEESLCQALELGPSLRFKFRTCRPPGLLEDVGGMVGRCPIVKLVTELESM
jgi:hypothetical protein